MDAVGGSIIQSPVNMVHDQLTSPLAYDGTFPMPTGLDMAAAAVAAQAPGSSKGSHGGIVKRSASSPNVRSLSTTSEPGLSLAEKRRNKLGYHRTSVACVHCRRRKIRCLLAPDDTQNRCSNCIRLKKECHYSPVDQQQPSERRPRTGSKVEVKTSNSVSSSSSPNVTAARSTEHGDSFSNFQPVQHGVNSYPPQMMAIGTSGISPPGSAAPQAVRFDLADQGASVGWDTRFFEGQQIPSGHPGTEDHGHGYWKVPDTPLTPYSPYSSAPPSGIAAPQGSYISYTQPRADAQWPLRSMSYSHIDEAAHQRHDGSATTGGAFNDMRRSTIDMPPPAPPSLHSSSTSTSASIGVELSGWAAMPAGWNMLPSQSPKAVDFGPWYSDPSQLSKVQEEDVSHFGDQLQGTIYASDVQR